MSLQMPFTVCSEVRNAARFRPQDGRQDDSIRHPIRDLFPLVRYIFSSNVALPVLKPCATCGVPPFSIADLVMLVKVWIEPPPRGLVSPPL